MIKCGAEGEEDGTSGCMTYQKKGASALEMKDCMRQQYLEHVKNFQRHMTHLMLKKGGTDLSQIQSDIYSMQKTHY